MRAPSRHDLPVLKPSAVEFGIVIQIWRSVASCTTGATMTFRRRKFLPSSRQSNLTPMRLGGDLDSPTLHRHVKGFFTASRKRSCSMARCRGQNMHFPWQKLHLPRPAGKPAGLCSCRRTIPVSARPSQISETSPCERVADCYLTLGR